MKKLLALVALSFLPLLGCKEAEMNLETLTGQSFILIEFNGESYTKPNPPVIEFGENSMLFGKICNSFRGPAQLKDGLLTLKNAAATKMMCIDGELNSLESNFLKMLESGVNITAEASSITLKQGHDVLTFSVAPRN